MAQLLGNVAVGTIVKLNENGVAQNYLVVHQGLPSSMYDASCNGTWLLRQDIVSNDDWGYGNSWSACTIKVYIDKQLISIYDSSIQSVIKTVKIPYCVGGGSSQVNSGANGYPCKLFLLGGYEVGWTETDNSYLPVDGAKLSYFESGTSSSANKKRIAKLTGIATYWWLRSPNTYNNSNVFLVNSSGEQSGDRANVSNGVRPALVMPANLLVDDSNNIVPIPNITTLTAPSIAMQGQSIPLSWTPVSVSGFDVTYQLQRNVNNGGWQNVGSPISQTSYTDTAQSGWTEVQYQVAPVIEGLTGTYTQSSVIPVSDPAVLSISGSDGNLGTLTSNVPYTVSSNTGNPISLTRTVNGAQVVTLTAESGFAYSIPIADLPTGTGTIQITASVDNSGGTVTQTRTWTYYKTPINIPSTGGIAQLTQNGQNIWPITVPDAVEAPVYLGGNLNAALNKLGQAALYTKIGTPKYNQVTVDLSKVKVGDEVLLPENGVMVPFYVGSLNYEPTLNTGGNRVLLIRKNVYQTGQWNSSNVNTYANSTVDTWLNNAYKNLLGQEIQDNIGTTTFKYTPGNGNWTVSDLSRAVFLLSATELNINGNFVNTEGSTLSIYNIIKISNIAIRWTRSPNITNNNQSIVDVAGTMGYNYDSNNCNISLGYRPCFTLPINFNHTYYVDNSNNIYEEQLYTQGGSITDIFGYDIPICQYEAGTYVGTGTFGGSGNSITFSFVPKAVFITNLNNNVKCGQFFYGSDGLFWMTNATIALNGYSMNATWNSTQLSWTSNNAIYQMNESGKTYQYFAIG